MSSTRWVCLGTLTHTHSHAHAHTQSDKDGNNFVKFRFTSPSSPVPTGDFVVFAQCCGF